MTALPHSIEAERALLGAVLFDDAHLGACDRLRAEHFYEPVHKRVFAAIRALVAQGRRADQNTVAVRLAADTSLSEAGGASRAVLELVAAAARTRVAVGDYVALVVDLAVRREMIRVAREIEGLAAAPPEGEGAASLRARAEHAFRMLEDGIGAPGVTLRDASTLAVDNAAKGERGIKTGLAAIDALIGGLFAPDLVVLAGRPAMGKSSIAANIAHAVALRDYVVHFASQEMSAEQIAQRALSRASYDLSDKFPYRNFRRGGVSIGTARTLAERMPESFVIDEAGGQTLAHLQASARATQRRCGKLDLIVVDYLQLMRDDAIKRGDTAEITALTKGMKQLAKDMDVPILLLSQLSREVERRQDKRPQLSDLRQSGSIEQDADVVLFAFRENYYLTRSKPTIEDGERDADFDVRYHKWADRCEETSGRMEIIASKTRMDETGSSFLLVDLAYDVATDLPQDRGPKFHTISRGTA